MRQNYLLSYGSGAGSASGAIANLALRCLAICGLLLTVYLFFRPSAPNLLAKLNNISPTTASVSVDRGDVVIARVDGSFESMTDGSQTSVFAGDMIVAENGIVYVDFAHGQQVALNRGASVTIEQLEFSNGIQRVQLVVWSGIVEYSTVGKRVAEDYFYVSSTSSSSTIDRGTMRMEVVSPVQTIYEILDTGVATIQMDQQTIQLESTQQLTATLGDPLIVRANGLSNAQTGARAGIKAERTDSGAAQPPADSPQAGALVNQTTPDPLMNPVITHMIEDGDTLWSISMRYNVDVDAILMANPDVVNAALLQIDQQIYIPTEFVTTTALPTN